jgi:hypothetical protein
VVLNSYDTRDKHIPVFRVVPTQGVIFPGNEVALTVTYQPLCAATFSTQDFTITTPGGNTPILQCTGAAIGMGIN